MNGSVEGQTTCDHENFLRESTLIRELRLRAGVELREATTLRVFSKAQRLTFDVGVARLILKGVSPCKAGQGFLARASAVASGAHASVSSKSD